MTPTHFGTAPRERTQSRHLLLAPVRGGGGRRSGVAAVAPRERTQSRHLLLATVRGGGGRRSGVAAVAAD
ncbi:unnamed protein product [Sphagnum compactum]